MDAQNPSTRPRGTTTWFALYGFLLVTLAFAVYVFGVGLAPLRWAFLNPPGFRRFNELLIWYSGMPLVAGSLLIAWDLFRTVVRLRAQNPFATTPWPTVR